VLFLFFVLDVDERVGQFEKKTVLRDIGRRAVGFKIG
jgi:hypothetical protein